MDWSKICAMDWLTICVLFLFIIVVAEIPVIVAYLRGLRKHKLNVIVMWTGIGIMFFPIWLVMLVMACVYEPDAPRRMRYGAL